LHKIRKGENVVDIFLRKARVSDLEKLVEVEEGATPGFSYVPNVFDEFVSDNVGEFIVAEADGEIVACGKFSVVPDGSAWLETLRVLPKFQGLGIGKRFYERFFEIAHRLGITTMRMYTGRDNVVSKGLAERFGFHLAASYRGAYLPCIPGSKSAVMPVFLPVTDPSRAEALLMPFREKWTGFLVMNRTFFALTPALCAFLAQQGMVYEEPASHSVITLGARFMPEDALHVGLFGGDAASLLEFARYKGIEKGVKRLSCLFPPSAAEVESDLKESGFEVAKGDYIVMEVNIK
jgi:N-acetylglutamate synthase-like GNAT family acetyltransferase